MDPKWLESVYSDGGPCFVSSPSPRLGETVELRLRMYADAPVRHVLLRTVPNGMGRFTEMERCREKNGLAWYRASILMNEPRVNYQFHLVCDDAIYYYTQEGVREILPDMAHDFVLLADYQPPAWVKSAVFYQIFPERFRNGDPSNDVAPGEYRLNGHPTLRRAWDDPLLPYREGFCLDFYGGDLEGVRQKLPYLKSLGVTALYLNPIFTAPSVHKYDCADYFHVDPHFGGDEALARLSEAAHALDMRLILDISINHTGAENRWFNRDGLFFDQSLGAFHNPEAPERGYYFFEPGTSRYHAWAGVADLPTLNFTSQALRERIFGGPDSVLRKWLKPPYSIDGWRFDVADTFARHDGTQLSRELWPQIRAAIREENPEAYILAEDWDDCAPHLQGDEWDAPMNYVGCARPLRQFVGAGDPHFAAVPWVRDRALPLKAEAAAARITQHLSRLPYALWPNQFNLLDSHDVPRLHHDPRVRPEEYRGAVILQFLLIGAPSIYYGDEADIGGWTQEIEGCRAPFPWDRDLERMERWQLYRNLAHLKAGDPLLAEGGQKFLYAADGVVALARFTDDRAYVGVMSVNAEPRQIRLPLGVLGASGLKGPADLLGVPFTARMEGRDALLTLPPHQAYLLDCIF